MTAILTFTPAPRATAHYYSINGASEQPVPLDMRIGAVLGDGVRVRGGNGNARGPWSAVHTLQETGPTEITGGPFRLEIKNLVAPTAAVVGAPFSLKVDYD